MPLTRPDGLQHAGQADPRPVWIGDEAIEATGVLVGYGIAAAATVAPRGCRGSRDRPGPAGTAVTVLQNPAPSWKIPPMDLPTQTRAFVIYVFGPSPEGKFYVGQTKDLKLRFRSHIGADGGCPEFHKAVQRYGLGAFPVQIVAETDIAEEADRLESLFITKFNSLIPHGYNLTLGGRGTRFQPGAKVIGFFEHPVTEGELRQTAQRMADRPKLEPLDPAERARYFESARQDWDAGRFPPDFSEDDTRQWAQDMADGLVARCPCCGEHSDDSYPSCRCGVARDFSRWLLGWRATGSGVADLPLTDDPKLVKAWRKSREAGFFLFCEKRRLKGRTITTAAPIAMQKYAVRFWPYLEAAIRRRCLADKGLPSYRLGNFDPLPGGRAVEEMKIGIEVSLRKNRRELGPGEGNIAVFTRSLGWQKKDSGSLYDAAVATFLEHGGSESEVAEAMRRAALDRLIKRDLPEFDFSYYGAGNSARVKFGDENWEAFVRFNSRRVIEDAVTAAMAVPAMERRSALQRFLESPPSGTTIWRICFPSVVRSAQFPETRFGDKCRPPEPENPPFCDAPGLPAGSCERCQAARARDAGPIASATLENLLKAIAGEKV
jgi:predicted GIY-YIG superfamily endonuclease